MRKIHEQNKTMYVKMAELADTLVSASNFKPGTIKCQASNRNYLYCRLMRFVGTGAKMQVKSQRPH